MTYFEAAVLVSQLQVFVDTEKEKEAICMAGNALMFFDHMEKELERKRRERIMRIQREREEEE